MYRTSCTVCYSEQQIHDTCIYIYIYIYIYKHIIYRIYSYIHVFRSTRFFFKDDVGASKYIVVLTIHKIFYLYIYIFIYLFIYSAFVGLDKERILVPTNNYFICIHKNNIYKYLVLFTIKHIGYSLI